MLESRDQGKPFINAKMIDVPGSAQVRFQNDSFIEASDWFRIREIQWNHFEGFESIFDICKYHHCSKNGQIAQSGNALWPRTEHRNSLFSTNWQRRTLSTILMTSMLRILWRSHIKKTLDNICILYCWKFVLGITFIDFVGKDQLSQIVFLY